MGALEGEGELAGLEIGNLLEHLVLKKKLFNDTFSKCERVPCEGGGWRGYGVKVQH